MNGILRIADKLMANDRSKFAALLAGISFAVLLMRDEPRVRDRHQHRAQASGTDNTT